MKSALMLINNEERAATNQRTYDRINPITGDVATRTAAASVDDAIQAADAAAKALPVWAALGPNARRNYLLKAAAVLEAKSAEFAEAMANEIGATKAWSGFNIYLAALILREAASLTTQISGETIPSDRPGCMAMTVRQPAGVVLGIAPWNAPIILGVRAIATPLACGNSVILKASETCPLTHRLIGDVMKEAGLPAGVVNVVTNAPEDAGTIVSTLIRHPAVRRINFTGSTKVGRIIAVLAAEELKPVVLELGGKAPMLVLEDANIDEAVAAAAFGSYMNSGQICMSTERIIVDEKIADAFLTKFKHKVASLVAGTPVANNSPLGSVSDARASEGLAALIDDAISKGAEVFCAAPAKATLLSATYLDRVTPDMRIYAEESFGPITSIIRVSGDEQAIQIANDTEYGLTSSIFSQDVSRALSIANRIQAGMCHINGPTVHDEPQMPFGGMKASGYGRFGGQAGIAEFTDLRWITIDTQAIHYPI